jgi:hypothetical protein
VSRDPLTLVRRELRDQLRQRVDARGLATAPPTERRMRVREEAMAVLRERGAILPARELARVVNEVSDDVVGFGPIEFLLKDPSVTEVMLVGPDDAFVKHEGQAEVVEGRSWHAMRGAHPSWCEATHSLRAPAIARPAYTAANARNTAPTPDVSPVKSTMAITVKSRAATALPMTCFCIQIPPPPSQDVAGSVGVLDDRFHRGPFI